MSYVYDSISEPTGRGGGATFFGRSAHISVSVNGNDHPSVNGVDRN